MSTNGIETKSPQQASGILWIPKPIGNQERSKREEKTEYEKCLYVKSEIDRIASEANNKIDEIKTINEELLALPEKVNKSLLNFIDFLKYYGLFLFVGVPLLGLIFVFTSDRQKTIDILCSTGGVVLSLLFSAGAIFSTCGFLRTYHIKNDIEEKIKYLNNKINDLDKSIDKLKKTSNL